MSRIAQLVAALALAAVPEALALTNPHVDTSSGSSCLFCHVEGFETARDGEYTLLKDSIEELCVTCHRKTECCTIGQEHMEEGFIGASHPSDLDEREIQRKSMPRTLPLQDGKLTCNTCHFHRRPPGRDYKLVRLVEFTADGVEWTKLCLDCHADD